MGTLYVVSTPIGNLEDVTLRALRILREADLIAAEDTRVTRTLLRHYEIDTPVVSFHEFTTGDRRGRLLERLNEGDVALVTDAGTPSVSDPGFPLVRDALTAGHDVVPVPGPSAVIAALVVSGLPTHAFQFHGFLPRTAAQRRRFFQAHADDAETLVVYESPHRVRQALDDLVAVLGPDRPIAVARELTKKFEEVRRGPAGEVLVTVQSREPRGEYTLVVGGRESLSKNPQASAA